MEGKRKFPVWAIVLIISAILVSIVVTIYFGWQGAERKNQIAMAQSYMNDLASRLELYKGISTELGFTVDEIYPKDKSYQAMITTLKDSGLITDRSDLAFLPKSVEPTPGFNYYYCSSNGEKYKLEAFLNDKLIITLGNDTCFTK